MGKGEREVDEGKMEEGLEEEEEWREEKTCDRTVGSLARWGGMGGGKSVVEGLTVGLAATDNDRDLGSGAVETPKPDRNRFVKPVAAGRFESDLCLL